MNLKPMKIIGLILLPGLIYLLYVIAVLAFGTINDFQPEEEIAIESLNNSELIANDSLEFTFMIWNIGYSGLGNQSDFFLDGGSQVRPSKETSGKYLEGIKELVAQEASTDFLLLQEVDKKAKRSYQVNEFEEIAKVIPNHSKAQALNFNVKFVPKPLMSFSPIGGVQSGLATYTKYKVNKSTRYQFPGSYGWPTRAFHLDRCFLETRIPLESGKELVIVNSHNSAYDGGQLKPLEMAYLKEHLIAEYAEGNYIIVGGDWNQCPPNFAYDSFAQGNADDYHQDNIPADYMPEGWDWAFDPTVATNRKLSKPYNKETTFTTLIDFYLVSPNVEVKEVKGISLDFENSDHQPVKLKIQLK